MENPITRAEHEEFRRRLEEENKRQDTDMAPTAVRFERWPGPFLLCGEVDKSAADRYF